MTDGIDLRSVLDRVKREGDVTLELSSVEEADNLVDGLYRLTEGISCSGEAGSPHRLTIRHVALFD